MIPYKMSKKHTFAWKKEMSENQQIKSAQFEA